MFLDILYYFRNKSYLDFEQQNKALEQLLNIGFPTHFRHLFIQFHQFLIQNWSTKDEIETSIRTLQSVRDEIESTFSKIEWRDDESGRENLYNTSSYNMTANVITLVQFLRDTLRIIIYSTAFTVHVFPQKCYIHLNNTLLKPKSHSLRSHGFMVHA